MEAQRDGVRARPLRALVAELKREVAKIRGGWVEAEVLEAERKGPHCYVTLSDGEDVRVKAKFFGHGRTRAERSLGGPVEAGQRLAVRVDRLDFYAPYGTLSALCSDARWVGGRRAPAPPPGDARAPAARGPARARAPRACALSALCRARVSRPLGRSPGRRRRPARALPGGLGRPVRGARAGRPGAGRPDPGDRRARRRRARTGDRAGARRGLADLRAFDDEELCRVVARSPVPVVAAVGHTANRPVAHEVAEASASVPREVAQIVCPSRAELLAELERGRRAFARAGVRLERCVEPLRASAARLQAAQRLEHHRSGARALTAALERRAIDRLAAEGRTLVERRGQLEEAAGALSPAALDGLSRRLAATLAAVPRPEALAPVGARLGAAERAAAARLEAQRRATAALGERVAQAGRGRCDRLAEGVSRTAALCAARDPVRHGFAVVRRAGALIGDARGLEAGEALEVELHDGRVDATVRGVNISEGDG